MAARCVGRPLLRLTSPVAHAHEPADVPDRGVGQLRWRARCPAARMSTHETRLVRREQGPPCTQGRQVLVDRLGHDLLEPPGAGGADLLGDGLSRRAPGAQRRQEQQAGDLGPVRVVGDVPVESVRAARISAGRLVGGGAAARWRCRGSWTSCGPSVPQQPGAR